MVLGLFKATLRPDTCLRVMTKNSLFSCFMVIFMSYCQRFSGSRRICIPRKNRYMFERYDEILVVFAFCGRFHELLPIVWDSMAIYNDLTTRYMLERHDKKLVVFVFMAIFMSYCPWFLG